MTAETNDAPRTLGDLALEVRSKNAGPFWMTLEAFMPDGQTYRIADALVTAELISELYHVPPASVQIFRLPDLRVVKVSFPRPITQGSLHDRDMHAGQHHVPLANVVCPLPSLCCSKYSMISAPALWPGCASRFGWQLQVFGLIEVGLSRCLSELISQPGTSW
jgi:hypothetical protein